MGRLGHPQWTSRRLSHARAEAPGGHRCRPSIPCCVPGPRRGACPRSSTLRTRARQDHRARVRRAPFRARAGAKRGRASSRRRLRSRAPAPKPRPRSTRCGRSRPASRGSTSSTRSSACSRSNPCSAARPYPSRGSGLEDLTRFYIVSLPEGADLAGALDAYAALSEVASAEPSPLLPVAFTPNDPIAQWHLNQFNDHDSDVSRRGTRSRATPRRCSRSSTRASCTRTRTWAAPRRRTPPATSGRTTPSRRGAGVDDDGNGFIDDFRGWDFVSAVTGRTGRGPGHRRQRIPRTSMATARSRRHGRRAHEQRRRRGRAGIQVEGHGRARRLRNGTTGVVDLTWCAQGINYAVQKGAIAVNCSWSNSSLAALTSAVNNALARGVTVCARRRERQHAEPGGQRALGARRLRRRRGDRFERPAGLVLELRLVDRRRRRRRRRHLDVLEPLPPRPTRPAAGRRSPRR